MYVVRAGEPEDQTSEPRTRQSWTPPRRTIGTVGLGAAAAGANFFLDGIAAEYIVAGAALLGGIVLAEWAFVTHAAASHREAARADLAEVAIRQARIAARQEAALAQVPTRAEMVAAVREADAGGYLRGVRRRMNGTHLRSVPSGNDL